MANEGKIQLSYVMVCSSEHVEEGKRLFRTHGPWMESTHPRHGSNALLSYNVSIAPELSNPMDAASEPTGRTVFVLSEIYESEDGVVNHFEEAQASWSDFPALVEWIGKCDVAGVPAARIVNSLW